MKRNQRKPKKEKELKAKPNEQTSIFKKFSFSTFFVTLLLLLPLFFHPLLFVSTVVVAVAFAFNVKLLTELIPFAALICTARASAQRVGAV